MKMKSIFETLLALLVLISVGAEANIVDLEDFRIAPFVLVKK